MLPIGDVRSFIWAIMQFLGQLWPLFIAIFLVGVMLWIARKKL